MKPVIIMIGLLNAYTVNPSVCSRQSRASKAINNNKGNCMRLVAYVYEAAYHCPECAKKAFGSNDYGLAEGEDREGNPIQGVYDFEMTSGETHLMCGSCSEFFEV